MNLKQLVCLLCLICCVTLSTAQKPLKVKKLTEKLLISTAKFQVLKSNEDEKHGFYKEYDFVYKKLIVSGNYYLGEKDGLWKEWYVSNEILKNEGNYKDNKKVGVWKYYNLIGGLLHTYNHDTNTLLFSSECGNNIEYEVIIDEVSVLKTLDCPPSLLGGLSSLNVDINNTYFILKKDKSEGFSSIYSDISILIKKDGTIGEINANGSVLNPDYIAILEEKINDAKNVWLPAELDGERVEAYVQLKSIISTHGRN